MGFWTVSLVLLLVPGLALTVGGFAVFFVGGTATDVNEANQGDNDGDGRVDEDGYGDADNSAKDPTRVSGPAEVTNPADDDADGRLDEDPPYRADVGAGADSAAAVGGWVGFAGLLLIGVFGVAVWRRYARRHELRLAELKAADAPTTAAPEPPGTPPAPGATAAKRRARPSRRAR
jgi:hypothetical protein